MAGAPSQKTATEFGQQMKNARTLPYALGSIQQGEDLEQTKLLNSNLYPTRFIPSDDFDTEWMIRQQLVEGAGSLVSEKRPMPWTENEISYMKRKRDAEEYAAYNDWLVHRFPLNDPANRELLKRTVPRYFEERKQVLQEQINLSAKYANLRLFGPENEDDLKLEYMVETGRVKLPEGPFHDPLKWMERQANTVWADNADMMATVQQQNRNTYEKGLFNPFSFLTWNNAPWAPNPQNLSDPVGDERLTALGPVGVNNPTNENYQTQYRGPGLGQAVREADWARGNNRAVANWRNNTAALAANRPAAYTTRMAVNNNNQVANQHRAARWGVNQQNNPGFI